MEFPIFISYLASTKEELSHDAMMKGLLGLVDKSGILGPEEILGAVSPHGDKTGHCCSK